MPQSGCFIIQLPRRVLRVYWLGYLPGSVCRERVSGASSLVCAASAGLNNWPLTQGVCMLLKGTAKYNQMNSSPTARLSTFSVGCDLTLDLWRGKIPDSCSKPAPLLVTRDGPAMDNLEPPVHFNKVLYMYYNSIFLNCKTHRKDRIILMVGTMVTSWIVKRLDWKLARVSGSNMMEVSLLSMVTSLLRDWLSHTRIHCSKEIMLKDGGKRL